MFTAAIAGNTEQCRTEATILDESGKKLAVIYEDMSGWHTDFLDEHVDRESKEFQSMIGALKQKLSRFVNRKGQPPRRMRRRKI